MNPIFFLHINKTGGQTLASRLSSAFDPDRVYYQEGSLRYPEDAELFSSLVKSRDFFGGHVSGPILADRADLDVLTTIREPIDRLISNYRHIRRETRDLFHRPANTLTARDFFRNYKDHFANSQSRYIVSATFQVDRLNFVKNTFTQWMYEKLPDAIAKIRWLVPTEAIDDFTWLWSKECHRHVSQGAILSNLATPDNISTASVRQVIEDYPELYALDLELWNRANQWMQNYKKSVLTRGIDRRVLSTLAFENAGDAIWLTDGWLPPLRHDDGIVEWWAGPNVTSEICFRRTGSQAILFDIPVVLGIAHTDIQAYSASDFRPLTCRLSYEHPEWPTVRLDLSGMGAEGTILINVPRVLSPIQVSDTDTDTARRSFSSARWRFDSTANVDLQNIITVGTSETIVTTRKCLPMLSEKSRPCKLCGQPAEIQFGLPRNKRAGHPIPNEPDDCWYYQCTGCKFLFTDAIDMEDHTKLYDETYWDGQDPDWHGRVTETLRLILLANELLHKRGHEIDVLDFGCGMGTFVESGRKSLGMRVWGTDIITPKFGQEWYLADLGDKRFDVITACEVIEHLPDPRKAFDHIRAHLKSPGVFAFQTAQWDPTASGRDWWYLGPHNGHISLYSREGLAHVYHAMDAAGRRMWNDYPGVQAWMFE